MAVRRYSRGSSVLYSSIIQKLCLVVMRLMVMCLCDCVCEYDNKHCLIPVFRYQKETYNPLVMTLLLYYG